MIYLVSMSDYDSYMPTLVDGPEVSDFNEYCNSLLDEAAILAFNKKEKNGTWISGDDVIKSLIDILVSKGYKVIKPDEFEMDDKLYFKKDQFPESISDKNKKKIINYNKSIQKNMMKEVPKGIWIA